MAAGLPRAMGIAWVVTNLHLVTLGILLLPMHIGLTLRLFLEQAAWAGGLFMTGGRRPDEWVLALHLAALFFTLVLRWLWQQGHPWLRRGFVAAGAMNALVGPIGLVPGLMFLWLARRPDLDQALAEMRPPTGKPWRRLALHWYGATIAMTIACIPLFLLMQGYWAAWALVHLVVAAIPGLVLWAAIRQPKDSDPEMLHVMPPLPEMAPR